MNAHTKGMNVYRAGMNGSVRIGRNREEREERGGTGGAGRNVGIGRMSG